MDLWIGEWENFRRGPRVQLGEGVLGELKTIAKKWPPDVAQCRQMSLVAAVKGQKRLFGEGFGVLEGGWNFLAWVLRKRVGLNRS